MRPVIAAVFVIATGIAVPATAASVLMSAEWGKDACEAWNKDPVLTDKLMESGWIKNDKGRGYKVMQIYRSDCGSKPTAEMRIVAKDKKAVCTYGGGIETARLDDGADYVMSAETARWLEMGKGEYGPMKAMMLGRLGFEGPKMEAMGNMEPFGNFLLIVGSVPGETTSCPGK
jgi:putative sterol carrier protein